MTADTPVHRPSLRRRSGLVFGAVALLLVAGAVAAGLMLQVARNDRNQLLNRLDPALEQLNAWESTLTGESTGARGYALSGNANFLALYHQSVTEAATAAHKLAVDAPPDTRLHRQLDHLDMLITSWHDRFIDAEAATTGRSHPTKMKRNLTGATFAFAGIRRNFSVLVADFADRRQSAVTSFDRALAVLESVVGAVFVLIVLLVAGLWLTLRRSVLRPLVSVGNDSRRVTGGDLDSPVGVTGPAEIAELAESIEAMRAAVVSDLHAIETAHANLAKQERALAERSDELARSNRDLEQFAYVASHDLQEPLRKVASFCQLLADRYGGQLDERGEQYIVFAVDGAKRMQALVNDLLSFSRVGRSRERWADVDLSQCVVTARANLERRIQEAGAVVEVGGTMPTVTGDPSLLTALFQNLIGNSIKFRGEEPPLVRIGCSRQDEAWWAFAVADNGIGIEPEYADRVFTIFQRLHTRDRYEGTGIGLALCRRIVEFHGGSIGVDTEATSGTTVRFTLPAVGAPAPDRDEESASLD